MLEEIVGNVVNYWEKWWKLVKKRLEKGTVRGWQRERLQHIKTTSFRRRYCSYTRILDGSESGRSGSLCEVKRSRGAGRKSEQGRRCAGRSRTGVGRVSDLGAGRGAGAGRGDLGFWLGPRWFWAPIWTGLRFLFLFFLLIKLIHFN